MSFKNLKIFSCILLSSVCFSIYADSVDDKDIDTQIELLYQKNPVLNEKKVCSETKNQQVTLKGCVNNQKEKELAEDLASLIDYTESIDNQIKIKSSPRPSKNRAPVTRQMSDAVISHLVHAKLALSPVVDATKIQVKTHNKITFLTGSVATPKEKLLAYQIAESTKGVLEVKNKLKVA